MASVTSLHRAVTPPPPRLPFRHGARMGCGAAAAACAGHVSVSRTYSFPAELVVLRLAGRTTADVGDFVLQTSLLVQ